MKISKSQEDYLERILLLANKESGVRVTDLAASMNISKPSVHKATKLLKMRGLINQEKYGPISLTEDGSSYAKALEKRHMVLKKFLCEILKVDEVRAEEEACAIEHVISASTIESLDMFLKNWNVP